ncbi:unnamed protein product [Rhizoctonia solani]|uniref:Uncharacterized protein n=1 Tax=Rhizoctonia solani TaxID=456999 RepID=A0A8H3GE54_9AGAM|nr:unnamed protein product [Rhizoctonia solani]
MMFVSRLIVAVGALFATARDFSGPPDPGDYANLIRWNARTSTTTRMTGHSVAPIKVLPSGSVTRPRGFSGQSRGFTRVYPRLDPPSPIPTPHSNTTRLDESSSQWPVFTVLPYEGLKELAPYDDRRALVVYGHTGTQELVVYYRPTAIAIYSGLVNYVQFWVNPKYYDILAHVYRPRFVADAHLTRQYAHLDPTDFDQWAVDNPIDAMLVGERSCLRKVLGATPLEHQTIGHFERRPEESASRILAYFHSLGVLFALAIMVSEEYTELQRETGRNQPTGPVNPPGGESDWSILPGVVDSSGEKQTEATAGNDWWKNAGEGSNDIEYSTSMGFLELPAITTPEPIPLPVVVETSKSSNPPIRPPKALPPRPSGPRFKTAAWRRCRVK